MRHPVTIFAIINIYIFKICSQFQITNFRLSIFIFIFEESLPPFLKISLPALEKSRGTVLIKRYRESPTSISSHDNLLFLRFPSRPGFSPRLRRERGGGGEGEHGHTRGRRDECGKAHNTGR